MARELGVPAYVPHRFHVTFNRRHRRVIEKLLPALPGMVFVHTYFSPFRPLPGVLGWMRDGTGSPLVLSDQDFEDMRALEVQVWRARRAVHSVGDRVRFEGGHFEGQHAIIERLRGNRAFFRLLTTGVVIEAGLEQVA